jgi:hypothetical protein
MIMLLPLTDTEHATVIKFLYNALKDAGDGDVITTVIDALIMRADRARQKFTTEQENNRE